MPAHPLSRPATRASGHLHTCCERLRSSTGAPPPPPPLSLGPAAAARVDDLDLLGQDDSTFIAVVLLAEHSMESWQVARRAAARGAPPFGGGLHIVVVHNVPAWTVCQAASQTVGVVRSLCTWGPKLRAERVDVGASNQQREKQKRERR